MKSPLIDEQVLDGIPDELIRPLLAMSIRTFRPHTIESYKKLLKDARKLRQKCLELGGQSGYYLDLENMVNERMQAMTHAQAWARKADSEAEATSIDINRWRVNVHSNGHNRALLVAYERAGMDI